LTVKTQAQKRNNSLYMAIVIIIVALASGLLSSLASGLYTRDLTPPPPFVGGVETGYGFPLTWLKKVTIVYPGSPTNYSLSLSGFLADFALWSLLMGVLAAVIAVIRTTVRQRKIARSSGLSNSFMKEYVIILSRAFYVAIELSSIGFIANT